MCYSPPEIQKSPIEVQPAVHKDPAWLLLFSCSVVSDSLWPYELQYARLPCPSPSPEACSNSFHWVADAIQPSHPLSCLLLLPSIFPRIRFVGLLFVCFPMSWLFSSGGQNIGASVSVLPLNIQGWFPLGLTDWISLQSKGLSRVFSILQHHSLKRSVLQHSAFFMVQLLQLYLTTGKTIALTLWTFVGKVMSLSFNTLPSFVTTFLPRSEHLLISQ